MRFLFFFLGIYLLGLSCIPCSDSEECNAKETTAISASNNHEEHKHKTEHCTPFCTCSCCTASALYTVITKGQITRPSFTSEKYPLFNVVFDTEVYHSIWQPPKIAA